MKTFRFAVALVALGLAAEIYAQGPFINSRSQKLVYDVLTGVGETPPRTIVVWTGADTVVGKQYPTAAAAITYVNTQTHDASNIWNIVCIGNVADSVPINTPTFVKMWGSCQISADTLDLIVQTQGATDVVITGGDDVNILSADDVAVTPTGLFSVAATETATITGGTGASLIATTANAAVTASAGEVALSAVAGSPVDIVGGLLELSPQAGAIPVCAAGIKGAIAYDVTDDVCVCNGSAWVELLDGDAASTGCA